MNSVQLLESQKHHQFQLTISQQHQTIRLFESWTKLKRFDESLLMNVFTLHADGRICLLCPKHPAVTTGQGKYGNIYTIEPARPPHPNCLDNYHPSSDQHQKANSLEKTQRISLFQAIHQDLISDKVNTAAERVHLIYWVSKEEIADRNMASLQILVDRIGHNDRLPRPPPYQFYGSNRVYLAHLGPFE